MRDWQRATLARAQSTESLPKTEFFVDLSPYNLPNFGFSYAFVSLL
jgi:hypothetical protein